MTMPGTPEGAPPAAAAPPAAPPAAPAEVDLESPLTQDSFDRTYVEKLRAEAARHRTAAKDAQARYDAQFEGLEDRGDFDYLLGMARKLNTDPSASVKELRDLADRLGEQLGIDTKPPVADPATDPRKKVLTVEDLEKIEFDREVARQTEILKADALALSDDRYSFADGREEYARLLWIGQNDPEVAKVPFKDRLSAAAAKIKAHDEAVGAAAVAAYVESVRAGGDQFPPASAPGGGAPAAAPGSGPPKGWKNASASALERITKAL
jgi:hypothetical protein